MKRYLFLVAVCGGLSFTQMGEGRTLDAALMDACKRLADSGNMPEEDIEDVNFIGYAS